MSITIASQRKKSSRSRSEHSSDGRITDWINETSLYPPPPVILSPSSKHKNISWHSRRRNRPSSFSRSARRIHRTSLLRSADRHAALAASERDPESATEEEILGTGTPYPAITLLITCFGIAAMLPSLLVVAAFAALLSFSPLLDGRIDSDSEIPTSSLKLTFETGSKTNRPDGGLGEHKPRRV